jgi:alpha-L-rhamnosidase
MKFMKIISGIVFLTTILLPVPARGIGANQLKTDRQTEPLGFDNPCPGFSWIVISDDPGTFQQAYEIIVGTDIHKLETGKGNAWQSGRVESSRTFNIRYSGKPLSSFTRYFWKVRLWDQDGKVSGWSPASWFETGMMKPSDWKAKWISDTRPLPARDEDFYRDNPNPLLRKEITVKKRLRSARLYVAGLGYSVNYINGQRVGDHMLDMPWTNFNKQVMYNTFDVTSMLSEGVNTIASMLGNGWYNPMPFRMFRKWNLREELTVGKPCLKAQLRLLYADGSVETIITDETWKAGEGPVLMNSVYLGETLDARLEQEGWNDKGFNDSQWTNAAVIKGPSGELIACYIPPVRVTRILKPVKMTEPRPGVYIFDFGQNFAGVPRLKVKGPAGTRIVMRGGEDIHADGTLNYFTVIAGQLKSMWNFRGGPGCPDDPMMRITYILRGDDNEEYTPLFTFSGFRYIEVTGFPGKPDLNSIEGLRMNTDLRETGSFECSNDFFNRLQEVVKWTFLSNVFSVQSDCPAREKFGYGADMVVTAEAFCYNFDMSGFYRKVVQDFANDARPSGGMTEVAPSVGINDLGIDSETGPPGWQLAFPFGIKVLHDYYGDIANLEMHYETLKKQVDFLHERTPGNVVQNCISDHESLDPRPIPLSATAFYYHHVIILEVAARLLNKQDDAAAYEKLAGEIKETFIRTFLKPGTGVFDTGTQGAQLIALYYNLVPEAEKEAAVNRLLSEIYFNHRGHLSTGIFATKFMFDFFRQVNRDDISYSVANQRTYPGWGNMLANGATTLYESWEYPDTLKSQNHPMFGSVSEWFYKSLLGINALAPGFSRFEIKPHPSGDLLWAKGYYDSMTGRITSEWNIEGIHFNLKVSIPANTRAMISIPSIDSAVILANGKPAKDTRGLKFAGHSDGYTIFEAEPGDYSLVSVWQN